MRVKIGNSGKEFAEIGPSPGRTEFQTQYAMEIARREDFDFFCISPTCDRKYRGTVVMTWYDKKGRLHADKVGIDKLIKSMIA